MPSNSSLSDMEKKMQDLHIMIDDLEKRLELLKESEEWYRNIYETVPVDIVLADANNMIMDINPHLVSILGKGKKSKKSYIGENLISHPDIINAGLSKIYQKVIECVIYDNKDAFDSTVEIKNNGYYNIKGMPLKKNNDILGVMIIHEDITERKLVEEKWLLFLKASTEIFSLYDSNLNLFEINDMGLQLFEEGITREEIIGHNICELIPNLKKTGDYKHLQDVIRTGKSHTLDEVTPHPRFKDERLFKIKAFKVGDGLGLISTDITERKRTILEMKKQHNRLEELVKERTLNLEEANTALKVLLKRREEDKLELEEKMMFNVKELVDPYLDKLIKSNIDERQKVYIDIIKSNIEDIISPFVRGMSSKYLKLTHTEIQVSNLVKQGKSTKEMADLLNLSSRTIESYRDSIRKKLGIKNKKVNLRTYLLSMQ